MFIIWGWRAVKAAIGTGQFFCPQCQQDTTYRHVAPRMWFTLFFLPIIPLKALDPFVECTRCSGAFVEAVLASPTAAVFEHHLGLANRAMVAHLTSMAQPLDGSVEAVALGALASAAGVPADYDRQNLHRDVQAFARPDAAAEYVRPLAQQMTVEGREELLRRVIVLADQLPSRVDVMPQAIDAFAEALGITPAHLAGIRATALRAPGTLTSDGDA